MEPLNNIDVIVLIVVALSMIVAFIRGFVKEILSITGLVLFLLLTFALSPILTKWMNTYIASELMARVVVFFIIMAVFYAFWIIGSDKIISRIRKSTLSFMDRLFGLIFGFFRAVLILGLSFLVVKIIVPEELKSAPLKDAKYFMMAEPCAYFLEKLLPEDFTKDMVRSVEDFNKVEKKEEKLEKDKKQEEISGLPSKLDQKKMDEVFEMLVNPQVKNDNKTVNSKKKTNSSKASSKIEKDTKENNKEPKSYDKKETSSLDKLIDITIDE